MSFIGDRVHWIAIRSICIGALVSASFADATVSGLDATTSAAISANSYANIEEVRVRHITLDVKVDFASKRLRGNVVLELERIASNVRELLLDTADLNIARVEIGARNLTWRAGRFALSKPDPVLGTRLWIDLPPPATHVRIHYSTSPHASALQWLTPSQTAGKRHPFLYTQSQTIHARSWIPLQDTPFVRATYDARVRVRTGLRAVMGAEMSSKRDASGDWIFHMSHPIPSYLIALAVGDIAFRSTGLRTGVYAEPVMLEKAAFEFAETEKTLSLMEQAFGPYRWGRFDILVLPPSFPYGGMENPMLTFSTPTAITGDRMLVSLISHEIAHSWSSNVVANASWNDVWLNEGLTQHLTYRLLEMQFGKDRADVERVRGFEQLKQEMTQLPRVDWPLVRVPPAKDPDHGINAVPYERGALFFAWLETQLSREGLDAFLRAWLDDRAMRSASTGDFVAKLTQRLTTEGPPDTQRKVNAWLYEYELPDFAVLPRSEALAEIDARRERWLQSEISTDALEAQNWSVHEWEQFLSHMPDNVTRLQLKALDDHYMLTRTSNPIIASAWYRLAVAHNYVSAYPALKRYLRSIGRVLLIEPLYAELVKSVGGREFARKTYAQAKSFYHPIARSAIEQVVFGHERSESRLTTSYRPRPH